VSKNIIRLYCTVNLKELLLAQTDYALTREQNHYLIDVMRCKVGDKLHLLDGKTGDYECRIRAISKKKAFVKVVKLINSSRNPADLWLLFAPIKKARTELIIEKCVELGVKKIQPVITDYTNLPKINNKRFTNIMISSVQQCGSTWLPELEELKGLKTVLEFWDPQRIIIFCDERLDGTKINTLLQSIKSKPIAILIGPEGGFSELEFDLLKSLKFVRRVSLGPQILRAETAAIASISIWQSICGVWSKS
tara:strand:- start:756 stop:1505 length:750 start_codon:yes stop_codon:yes gene_type:complete